MKEVVRHQNDHTGWIGRRATFLHGMAPASTPKRLGASLLSNSSSAKVWNRALDPKPHPLRGILESLSKELQARIFELRSHPLSHEEARSLLPLIPQIRMYAYQVGASKPDPIIYRKGAPGLQGRAEEARCIRRLLRPTRRLPPHGMKGSSSILPSSSKRSARRIGIKSTKLSSSKKSHYLSFRVNLLGLVLHLQFFRRLQPLSFIHLP